MFTAGERIPRRSVLRDPNLTGFLSCGGGIECIARDHKVDTVTVLITVFDFVVELIDYITAEIAERGGVCFARKGIFDVCTVVRIVRVLARCNKVLLNLGADCVVLCENIQRNAREDHYY